MNAKEIFKIAYGGNKNAMSDKILKYGKIGLNSAYEISSGSSLGNLEGGGLTYAVSVVILKDDGTQDRTQDYFKTFPNYENALTYAKSLRNIVKDNLKEIEKSEIEKPLIDELKKIFESNKKVYCVLKKVSSNGMNRQISFFTIKDNEHINLNSYIVKLLGYNGDYNAVKVGGCGMDMGFSVVYNLSSKVFKGVEKEGYVLSSNWV